jgi:chemotaxis protein methyltransferase CheR
VSARPGAGATGALAGLAAAPEGELSDADFGRFARLIHAQAGISLGPHKRALLVGRVSRRLRELGIRSWGRYLELVQEDPAELVRLLDAISTNETHFFREGRHFEYLAERALPLWRAEAEAGRRPRTLRVWSAACSTGEEPYSAAMLALALLPPASGLGVEVLGTDLSTKVLARAREAVWPLARMAEIPRPYLEAFMLRGVGAREGTMKAGAALRAAVRLERLNLAGETWPDLGLFDVVFLRNVLIYFDGPTRRRVAERAARLVAPGGHLLLGHAESPGGALPGLTGVFASVWRRAPAAEVAAARCA